MKMQKESNKRGKNEKSQDRKVRANDIRDKMK